MGASYLQTGREADTMKGFVPRGKMSKKQRKELDKKGRREWAVAPVTRVIPNKKKEAEKKPRPGSYDAGWGFPYIGAFAEKTGTCHNM